MVWIPPDFSHQPESEFNYVYGKSRFATCVRGLYFACYFKIKHL